MTRRWRTVLVVVLMCAALVLSIAVGTTVWRLRPAPPPPAPLSDRLLDTAAAVGSKGRLHVSPEMEGFFSESQLGRIEAAVEPVPGDVVVLVRWPSLAAGEPTSTRVLADMLGAHLQRRALYVIIGPDRIDYIDVGQSGRYLEEPRLSTDPGPEALVSALEADRREFGEHVTRPDSPAFEPSTTESVETGRVVWTVVGFLMIVLLVGSAVIWLRRRS